MIATITAYTVSGHNEYNYEVVNWLESRDGQYSNPADDQWEDTEFQNMRRGAH